MSAARFVAVGTSGRLPVLLLITFINLMGFGVVLPAFPFFGTMVNATPAETTVAMAAYSFGQFIGAPLWGRLSDLYGRRPILLSSLAGAIAAYILMAHADDIWMLGGSRLFGGLMAGNIAAAFAYVGDITTAEERPGAMGLLGAAFGLGFIFGPAIGGLIAGNAPNSSDFAAIGYASAAITAVAALATIFLLPESLTPERRVQARMQDRRVSAASVLRAKPVIAALMLLNLLVIGAAALSETTYAFFAHDMFGWGPVHVGLSFAAIGLISAVLQGVAAGPLARRFGSANVTIAGVAAHAGGLALFASAATPAMTIAGLAVLATGIGLFNPAFQTLASDQTNDADRGLVMGMTQGASSLGRVIGPAVSGSIYVGIGWHAPFAIGAAIMFFTLAISVGAVIHGKARSGRSEKPV